ncbi:helix-turn-helix domain-containing protein [Pelotomaculum propionicicum]|nr:helix-turn-helix domain-containing protein [Pelotomaculum propionicicum]
MRTKLDLSQSAFANIIGVSKKAVEAWEAGVNIPQGPAQRRECK